MPTTYWTEEEVEQAIRAAVRAERDACVEIVCNWPAPTEEDANLFTRIADAIISRNETLK